MSCFDSFHFAGKNGRTKVGLLAIMQKIVPTTLCVHIHASYATCNYKGVGENLSDHPLDIFHGEFQRRLICTVLNGDLALPWHLPLLF